MVEKIVKSDDEWRKQLTPEQFKVTRRGGTERAFTGALHATKAPGTYRCVCCGQDLFDSTTKFESGTGWPSFYAPVDDDAVVTETDPASEATVPEEATLTVPIESACEASPAKPPPPPIDWARMPNAPSP